MNTRQRIAIPSATPEQEKALAAEPMVVSVAPAPVTKPFPPVIAAAILRVMKGTQPIAKRGENTFHKYTYPKWEDMQEELTPLVIDAGLIIMQNEISATGLKEDILAVTYEFTIIHESGEEWPLRPRFTATCKIKDNKGQLDDKSTAKCHTTAQKYFHAQLFRLRFKDMDEADIDNDQGSKGKAKRVVPSSDGRYPPHAIETTAQDTAMSWAIRLISHINRAASMDELAAWDKENDETISRIMDRAGNQKLSEVHRTDAAKAYNSFVDAIEAKKKSFATETKTSAITHEKRGPDEAPKAQSQPSYTDDERDWLSGLGGSFSGCEDTEELVSEAERLMDPCRMKVSDSAWDAAEALYQEHFERLSE